MTLLYDIILGGISLRDEAVNGNKGFDIAEKAKEILVSKLTDELIFLRTKLGLSQDELSNLIGISRQTYSTLETKKRVMTWGTYLSLILIFDNYEQTHEIIRNSGIFPYMLFGNAGNKLKEKSVLDFSGLLIDEMKDKLDDQALHAIETVIMLEYARCNKVSGEAVIKAFDGRHFVKITEQDKEIADVINSIKSGVPHQALFP